jgi:chromatin remodeling complex protein RSC6
VITDFITSYVSGLTGTNLYKNQKSKTIKNRNKQYWFKIFKKNIGKWKSSKWKKTGGFNKPSKVPQKLCNFLNLEHGIELTRPHVTKKLYDIIRARDLQDPYDKRIIHPDNDFTELFSLEEGDDVRFWNFQTHLKKIYDEENPPKNNLQKKIAKKPETKLLEFKTHYSYSWKNGTSELHSGWE